MDRAWLHRLITKWAKNSIILVKNGHTFKTNIQNLQETTMVKSTDMWSMMRIQSSMIVQGSILTKFSASHFDGENFNVVDQLNIYVSHTEYFQP